MTADLDSPRLVLASFDPQSADDSQFAALTVFFNDIRTQLRPDRPPKTPDQMASDLRSRPSWIQTYHWAAWHGAQVVGSGYLRLARTDQNQHYADFWIGVLPDWRRRGIATELLRLMMPAARDEGRSQLACTTLDLVTGAGFAERFGGRLVQTMRSNQLDLRALNVPVMEEWIQRGESLRDEFDLGTWVGPYPEQDLPAVVRMLDVMNSAPHDDLEVEETHFTVEQQRDWDASLERRGVQRWTMYARHRPSGEIAGFTEVRWQPAQPDRLEQGDTGVFPQYRNRGLAQWLKASMLKKVITERPSVRFIRTGNSTTNVPMLHINERLGFVALADFHTWQLASDEVESRLGTISPSDFNRPA